MSVCGVSMPIWSIALYLFAVVVGNRGLKSDSVLADDVYERHANWTQDNFFLKTYEISSVKISAIATNHLIVYLTAYGRNFTLLLNRDYSIFHPGLTIIIKENSTVKTRTKVPKYYTGFEISDNLSWAHGEVGSGCFDGILHTFQTIYHVEPAVKYFPVSEKCIVYRVQDIDTSFLKSCSKSECDKTSGNELLSDLEDDSAHTHDPIVKREARTKRNATQQPLSCSLNLVADHLYFKHVGQNSVSKTISEMAFQIKEADAIFRSTDIDGDGISDNIGFVISGITVYTSVTAADYKMSASNMGDIEYLQTFSEYDFSGYCLAVAFTNRDFDAGVIGMAWVGYSNKYSYPGGICQKRVKINSKNKIYSFNTAMITFLNYGNQIPRPKSVITLAHEFGHSFGSQHDKEDDSSCVPEGDDGNFIMYPYATDGSKPNHNIFSTCSVKSMNPVIINKGVCLFEHTGPICGNGIPENGEECDCGDTTSCATVDPCCTPSDAPHWGPDLPCSLERSKGKICSPVTSPCCNHSCQLISSSKHPCSQETDCRGVSLCDGTSANCPEGKQKPNGTICSDEQRYCHLGECQTSLCKTYGLIDCMCSSNDHLCVVCCRTPTEEDCQPMDTNGNFLGETLTALPGEPCKNNLGYCNNDGKCILINSDSMLGRFAEMFGSIGADEIRTWFQSNWFYVVIGCFTLLLLIAVFVVNIKLSLNTHVLSKRMGKLGALLTVIGKQKERVSTKLVKTVDFYDRCLSVVPKEKSLDFVVAVSRLMMLFPTSPKEAVLQAVRLASCEEVAVKHLLLLGYPQIRILSSEQSDNPKTEEAKPTSL